MKTFFSFIRFNFLLFGFDIGKKYSKTSRISALLKIWMFLNPAMMIIGAIQLWVSFLSLTMDSSIILIVGALYDLLFLARSIFGYSTIILTRNSSIELIQKVEKIFTKITKNSRKIEDEEIVKRAFNLGFRTYMAVTSLIVFNFVMSLVKISIAALTYSDPGNVLLMSMWFPEFLQHLQLFIAIYEPIFLVLFSLSNLAASQLVFITSAYLAASFDELGDKVKDVIDGTENRSFLETKKKLSECVDIHSELIKLADESNRLYGPFNLTVLVLISMRICLLGIRIMVSQMMSRKNFRQSNEQLDSKIPIELLIP